MAREGILLEHVVEDGAEFFLWNSPSDEGAMGEFGGEEGLADSTNDSSFEHCTNTFEHDGQLYSRLFGDSLEGLALEASDEIFGYRENAGVDGVVVLGWDGVGGNHI